MTSNIGARSLTAMGSKLGFSAEERDSDPDAEKKFETAREQVMAELRQTFRPEFLNRIDDIIVFRPLTEEDIREVARLRPDGDHGHPPGCQRRGCGRAG